MADSAEVAAVSPRRKLMAKSSSSSSSSASTSASPSALSTAEYQLMKYLLLLATLVATVTYVAGLNPPGGSWVEDTPEEGLLAGDSILRHTNFRRYIVFYYFNAIAFAASLVLGLLLLLFYLEKERRKLYLLLMWTVMFVDALGLMGAYAAGISHDTFTTVCASMLVSGVAIYAFIELLVYVRTPQSFLLRNGSNPASEDPVGPPQAPSSPPKTPEKTHEILLVLAIFGATEAYVAGLSPPGGFWRRNEEGYRHVAGDPVLERLHPHRYKAFFFCNTTAFVTSLLAIVLIVDFEKLIKKPWRMHTLNGTIIVSLFGLGGSYAAGSCRDGRHTGYVILLAPAVIFYIYFQHKAFKFISSTKLFSKKRPTTSGKREATHHSWMQRLMSSLRKDGMSKDLEKTSEYIQLLATLAATVAYTAGLDPPGDVWVFSAEGHNAGDPILLTTHPLRYKVFFYFNSAALVASLVIVVMLQNVNLVKGHALEAAIILDFFSLIGAYAAGSCRDTNTTIATVALAGGVFVYVVIQIAFCTLEPKMFSSDRERESYEHQLRMRREVLLLLAILAATLTYQAGLTPPGGLWENDHGHRAGFPVLQDKYPRRYKAFFYCNAASFMASVALVVLLLNQDLYKPGIRCYALYVCMVAGMLALMGAYAAGSSMHMKTSIGFLAFVGAGFAIVAIMSIVRWCNKKGAKGHIDPHGDGDEDEDKPSMDSYLMLVGILAASVTYLTGLKPPGGMWREDGDGHSAGNPVLYDTNKPRYNVFFYCNSTSFVASIIVIALLLLRMMRRLESLEAMSLPVVHAAILLDVLALLIAYAAGSAPAWHTSWKVILLIVPMVLFIGFLSFWKQNRGDEKSHGQSAILLISQPNPSEHA